MELVYVMELVHAAHISADAVGSSLGKLGRPGAQPTKGPIISNGNAKSNGSQYG